MHYDAFNGDADGICALQQLRLANPIDSNLITGLKRDIQLLKQVAASSGDTVYALDISFDKNRDDVNRLIASQVEVNYFDHHFAGEIPESELLKIHIDTDANICTSLIMNNHLQGEFAKWAVVGAFGDNLDESALQLSAQLELSDEQNKSFKHLGICLNYNGYGFELDDLIFHPKELYLKLQPYADPADFIQNDSAYEKLSSQYEEDLNKAAGSSADFSTQQVASITLPEEKWAKRVVGVYGNDLARQHPDKAHAVLIPFNEEGQVFYRVSVRAPLNNKTGADEICRQFATGGGRKAAAGINALADNEVDHFHQVLAEYYKR